jgi:hypothetical protein
MEVVMNVVQTSQKAVQKMSQKTVVIDTPKTEYSILSKEASLVMTAEVIEKYRPALEKLAK